MTASCKAVAFRLADCSNCDPASWHWRPDVSGSSGSAEVAFSAPAEPIAGPELATDPGSQVDTRSAAESCRLGSWHDGATSWAKHDSLGGWIQGEANAEIVSLNEEKCDSAAEKFGLRRVSADS